MSVNPLIEISVAIRNNWEMTEKFLHNLFQTISTYDNVAVNIIDNASTDATVNGIEAFKEKATIFSNQTNKGFAFAHNMILRKSFAPFSCILHNDIKLSVNWLNSMVSYMQDNPRLGILGVTNDNYGDFSLGGLLCSNGNFEYSNDKIDFVHSTCMIIKSQVYKTVGCFDEKFVYGGKSDIDMCLKAQSQGFEIGAMKNLIIDHTPAMTARQVGLDNYAEQNRLLLLKNNEEWFIKNKGKAEYRIKNRKMK